MGVSCIDLVTLADAKGTIIIRRTCFDCQLAVQYKEVVRDLAVGVPSVYRQSISDSWLGNFKRMSGSSGLKVQAAIAC